MYIFYPVSLSARSRRPRAAALGEASRRRQVTQKLASFVAFVVHASLRSFPPRSRACLRSRSRLRLRPSDLATHACPSLSKRSCRLAPTERLGVEQSRRR